VSARIVEMVVRDERAVIPIGSFIPRFGVTLCVVGREGVLRVRGNLAAGAARLRRSAASLREALAQAGLRFLERQSIMRDPTTEIPSGGQLALHMACFGWGVPPSNLDRCSAFEQAPYLRE
jgi:hypothetical protein